MGSRSLSKNQAACGTSKPIHCTGHLARPHRLKTSRCCCCCCFHCCCCCQSLRLGWQAASCHCSVLAGRLEAGLAGCQLQQLAAHEAAAGAGQRKSSQMCRTRRSAAVEAGQARSRWHAMPAHQDCLHLFRFECLQDSSSCRQHALISSSVIMSASFWMLAWK